MPEGVAAVAQDPEELGGGAPGGELDTAKVVLESGDRGGFASVDRAPPTGEPVDHPALWVTEQLLDGRGYITNRGSDVRRRAEPWSERD